MGDVAPEPDNALTVLEYTFTVVPAVEFIPKIMHDAPLDEMVLMVLPLILAVVAAPELTMPYTADVDAVVSVPIVLVLIFNAVGEAVL
jgi:hypothetical protein